MYPHPPSGRGQGLSLWKGRKEMSVIVTAEYKTFLKEIKERIHKAQYDAFKSVNREGNFRECRGFPAPISGECEISILPIKKMKNSHQWCKK